MATDYGPKLTPSECLEHTEPTEGFRCSLSANTFDIVFQAFTVKDYDTKRVIFEVGSAEAASAAAAARPDTFEFGADFDEDSLRRIKYDFPVEVLRLPNISTTLTFSVGEQEVHDFRMIERHYFRDRLIKSYDFTFGFCIPNTVNTWEAVYAVPGLDEDLIEQILANPYETKSDSFYFVGDELIMHNKAEYRYFVPAEPAKGPSDELAGMGVTGAGVVAGKTALAEGAGGGASGADGGEDGKRSEGKAADDDDEDDGGAGGGKRAEPSEGKGRD